MKTIMILLVLVSFSLNAERINQEEDYQKEFARVTRGIINYQEKDITVDILADDYVIEIEYADKYAEAIGNVLYKSIRLKKIPLILLIIESKEDVEYLRKLLYVSLTYNIKVWGINKSFDIKEVKK